MKNMKYVFIVLGLFSFLAQARGVSPHTLDEYKNAFSIESLKKYIIDVDEDELSRAVFPEEKFKLKKDDCENFRRIKEDYFLKNKTMVLYEQAYLHVFNHVRSSALLDLEQQLRASYFSLHDLIVKTAIVPFIAAIFRDQSLGLIKDEKSSIRKKMHAYVLYFFEPFRKSHTINSDEENSDQSTPILANEKCPPWLRYRLSQAYKTHLRKFAEHYEKIEEIRNAIHVLNRKKSMQEETRMLLKEYGVSIRQLLPALVDGEDASSQELRRDIGDTLIEVLKEKYDLPLTQIKHGLDFIILHRDLAQELIQSKNTLINQFSKTKRTMRLKKKITTYEYVNGNRLREIVDKYTKR